MEVYAEMDVCVDEERVMNLQLPTMDVIERFDGGMEMENSEKFSAFKGEIHQKLGGKLKL